MTVEFVGGVPVVRRSAAPPSRATLGGRRRSTGQADPDAHLLLRCGIDNLLRLLESPAQAEDEKELLCVIMSFEDICWTKPIARSRMRAFSAFYREVCTRLFGNDPVPASRLPKVAAFIDFATPFPEKRKVHGTRLFISSFWLVGKDQASMLPSVLPRYIEVKHRGKMRTGSINCRTVVSGSNTPPLGEYAAKQASYARQVARVEDCFVIQPGAFKQRLERARRRTQESAD
ncbi:hypothetical protein [Chelatococcus asaccharovorans]|uniref:Uncharacterized protein n=1 Tax=Chelatococcus asaccharovorans TaxID=28210 RepID=A0A2V3TR00_9HYPH|nr:hypothetical protein [Chelatococcus asaccharovorans]MBS7707821.1 hypothetical protein [Chelatococcus asaccharovorans]PXW50934.1 hypothetical protein C7450_12245 [Chelatococcus asaccharovorans]